MLTLTRRATALALVSTLALTGCGDSDDDTPAADATSSTTTDASTDAPTDSSTIKGTGYTYTVPDGWGVPKQKIDGAEQIDSFAGDLNDKDGFTDNVNVIRIEPAPVTDADALETAFVKELEGAGSKDVTVRDRTDIDGDQAVHVASNRDQAGKTYLAEQYDVIHDGASYVITFSFSDTVSEADRDDLAASVLTSWAWAA